MMDGNMCTEVEIGSCNDNDHLQNVLIQMYRYFAVGYFHSIFFH